MQEQGQGQEQEQEQEAQATPDSDPLSRLRAFLSKHRLEECMDAVVAMGAKVPLDLQDVQPGDLVGLGMSVLSQRRFLRVVGELVK